MGRGGGGGGGARLLGGGRAAGAGRPGEEDSWPAARPVGAAGWPAGRPGSARQAASRQLPTVSRWRRILENKLNLLELMYKVMAQLQISVAKCQNEHLVIFSIHFFEK